MGLFDALTTAVSGLNAQSFAMQNISGNIANSQTTAYKGIDTSFANMIPGDSVPTRQIAGGVIANSRATNNVRVAEFQIAKANIPRNFRTQSAPYCSYA